MAWQCARCGGHVISLATLLNDRDFTNCKCSLCGTPMRLECFRRSPLNPKIAAEVSKEHPLQVRTVPGSAGLYFVCAKCERYIMVDHFEERVRFYEKTKRLEELAVLYEIYGYLELAGATRERTRQQTYRNINVDLNELIDALQRRGLATHYRCPGCGAPLTIDGSTRLDGVRFCGYCGGVINTEFVEEAVRSALR